MPSPFAISAITYREQGLAVIPCGPGTKFPGRFTPADGWWKAHDWQKYGDRLPTGFEMDIWERWPDAGVCLVLGRSSAPAGKILVAVDIDTDVPEEVAAIRSVIPGSPVAKRGAKGETQFYLASEAVENAAFNDGNKRRMLDLLAHGRQTVLPPTIHPDIGAAYHWITPDTLDDFPVADLPMLPDNIVERLGKALERFGYVEPPKLGEAADADVSGEKVHRALNDAALANLDSWVPALALYKCRKVGAGYKAVADWRPSSSGRPTAKRATNLAIRFDGIKDCGDGQGYTPLDLVMAACQADLETAFRWLQERVAAKAPVVLTSKPATDTPETPVEREEAPAATDGAPKAPLPSCEPVEPSLERTSPAGNLMGLVMVTSDGNRVADPPKPLPVKRAATVIPAEHCMPPGLLGDIVRWMVDADDTPSPQLALGASIAFLGAVMGRRFAHPSKSARTNFYCVGVAPTGFGKAHAILAVKELARRSNLDRYIGPGRYKSESAVRKTIEEKPTVVSLMDELGGVMRDILGRKASEHKAGIRDILLELFSSANTTYSGSEGAAEKAVPIHCPNLCVYGASTPGDLWGHVSSAAATDGFLPRWLVFDPGTEMAEPVDATADVFSPPDALRVALHELLDVRPKGNLNGVATVDPIKAAWGHEAEAYFKGLRLRAREDVQAANRTGDPVAATILTRVPEHVAKLSLVYAVGVHAPAPVITLDALRWAEVVVQHSTNALMDALTGKVADNDRHAEFLMVKNLIQAAGPDGMAESALTRKINGRIEDRRYGDIIATLKRSGEVWQTLASGPKGGRPHQRIGMMTPEAEAG